MSGGRAVVIAIQLISFWGSVLSFIFGNWQLGIVIGIVFVIMLVVGFVQQQAVAREVEAFKASLAAPGPQLIQVIACVNLAQRQFDKGDYRQVLDNVERAKLVVAQGVDVGSDVWELQLAHILALFLNGRTYEAHQEIAAARSFVQALGSDPRLQISQDLLSMLPLLDLDGQRQALGSALAVLNR